jgi:hypothetical protein
MKFNVCAYRVKIYADGIEVDLNELPKDHRPGGRCEKDMRRLADSVAMQKFSDALESALEGTGLTVGDTNTEYDVYSTPEPEV